MFKLGRYSIGIGKIANLKNCGYFAYWTYKTIKFFSTATSCPVAGWVGLSPQGNNSLTRPCKVDTVNWKIVGKWTEDQV